MAWALKRFACGKPKQKKDIKHHFKSRVFASALEIGKSKLKDLRWITNDQENDQIFYWQPLPSGWHFGMKKIKKRNKWITNGKSNRRIYDEDPLPKGWRLGITHDEEYIPIWITDGKVDRRICKGETIPEGWH